MAKTNYASHHFHLHVGEERHAALKQLAKREGTTMADLAIEGIDRILAERGGKPKSKGWKR